MYIILTVIRFLYFNTVCLTTQHYNFAVNQKYKRGNSMQYSCRMLHCFFSSIYPILQHVQQNTSYIVMNTFYKKYSIERILENNYQFTQEFIRAFLGNISVKQYAFLTRQIEHVFCISFIQTQCCFMVCTDCSCVGGICGIFFQGQSLFNPNLQIDFCAQFLLFLVSWIVKFLYRPIFCAFCMQNGFIYVNALNSLHSQQLKVATFVKRKFLQKSLPEFLQILQFELFTHCKICIGLSTTLNSICLVIQYFEPTFLGPRFQNFFITLQKIQFQILLI
eukprot:TRINITY_DN26449_c0_g1_i1.p1 TRINITY_DN26449_c0_g1~~TRINITY_DN26449_c0_g1_i1.p1  ORF type:complete len:277 (+),score=-18.19 TRINITY_DN26449_c0_g1_i1:276-1106(+)